MRAPFAVSYGLATSLLERIMEFPIYAPCQSLPDNVLLENLSREREMVDCSHNVASPHLESSSVSIPRVDEPQSAEAGKDALRDFNGAFCGVSILHWGAEGLGRFVKRLVAIPKLAKSARCFTL